MDKDLKRFFSGFNIDPKTDCWTWFRAKNQGGYGKFSVNGIQFVSHRWLYTKIKGEVPKGLDLDHLCRNRACCNLNHLEPVTRRENSIRGIGPALSGLRSASKTHCPYGHEYDSLNTETMIKKNGKKQRRCRACHRIAEAKRRQANKEKTDGI